MQTQNQTAQLALLVDGYYLASALRQLIDRSPTNDERIDFELLKRYAAASRPGGYLVAAVYFEDRRPYADSFYARLHHFGYKVILGNGERKSARRRVRTNIVAELEQLRETDHDVLYVGGDSYNGEVTAALNRLRMRPDGSTRQVSIAHFERSTNFDNEGFPLLDIVQDIEACPAHVYAESSDGFSDSKRYVSVDPQPQPGAEDNETALGAALRTARESASDFQVQGEAPAAAEPTGCLEANRGPESGGGAGEGPPADEAPLEPEPTPQPPSARNADGAPPVKTRGLLVLIDLENIDGALAEIIEPKPLNRQTRPDWNKLREFVEQRADDGLFVIKAFLQDGEKEKGFAGYLRSIGFEAVLLQREPRLREPHRQRSVVDEAICKNLAAVRDRRVDVLVVSHDGDYYEDLEVLRDSDPERRVGVVGFVELMNARYSTQWIERIDLEREVRAFGYRLPSRSTPVTVTRVDDYDPSASLDVFAAEPVRAGGLSEQFAAGAAAIAVPLGQKG